MITSPHRTWLGLTVIAACITVAVALTASHLSTARAANAEGKNMLLVHNVYFTLKESNEANRQKLVAACDKYLSDHPGAVLYCA
ncbi:MAG: hypothetical protein ACREHD_09585, partial [Pirellulales bacterium]